MLGRLTRLASSRRAKWWVIGAWVLVAVALSPLQPKLTTLAADESETFLVRGSESAEYERFVRDNFDYGNEQVTLVVFQNEDGLGTAELDEIFRIGYDFCQSGQILGITRVVAGTEGYICGDRNTELDFGPRPLLTSSDGTVHIMVITSTARDTTTVTNNVDAIRAVVPASDAVGLRAFVTGQGGFDADRAMAVEGIDETLMIITALLILVILLAIYRSPFIAGVPLGVVAVAYLITAGIVYGLVEAGLTTISGQTTAILIVLMFGAGTDYCLLILSRYKEELRRTEDHHEAMARATAKAGPAILSSGVIVVAVMLTLALADFNATREMGPLLALGIVVMMLAGFTLLPATLAALGRRAFWPKKPTFDPDFEEAAVEATRGVWRRVSALIAKRPGVVAIVVTALLLLGALGNIGGRENLAFTDAFRDPPDSVLGQEVVGEAFTQGRLAPVEFVRDTSAGGEVMGVFGGDERIASIQDETGSEERDEFNFPRYMKGQIELAIDPFSDEAADFIPEIREKMQAAAGDSVLLVGGLSAENHDTAEGVARDTRIIVPVALLLILLILAVQLRALVAPLYLVATVVLSFFFALGVSSLFFTHVLGQSGSDPNLEIFAFIFLVGLGVDYNIFLISRIREERLAGSDTRAAVLAGLEKTGGVITSAGLILAGTFSTLMALTFESMFQFGFIICVGLLVDTFIVRIFLVPAIAYMLGEKNWWPGSSDRSGSKAPAEAAESNSTIT